MFLIAINDFSVNAPTYSILYADDTNVITRNKSYNKVLEDSKLNQNVVEDWLTTNNLCLNKDKTTTIVFSLREQPDMHEEVPHPKFLGVTFDIALNWRQHVNLVKSKLSSSIFAIKRLCGELDKDALVQAFPFSSELWFSCLGVISSCKGSIHTAKKF